jgi:hypothetical protein
MPSERREKQHLEQEPKERPQLNATIADNVIQALGKPGDLYQIQVKSLWTDHYRVNVLVGADASSARVAHSYFLAADSKGGIVTSTPKIAREY